MLKYCVAMAVSVFAATSFAAHHEEPAPMIAEIYACTLNDGYTTGDLVSFAREDFKAFADKHQMAMNTFIWEAVAVTPPADEPDLRWVNYFPAWTDYFAGDKAWRANGEKVAAGIFERVTCDKAITAAVHNAGAQPGSADEKPLITMPCQLKEGKTIEDALKYRKGVNAIANELIDGSVGSAVFTPALGASGVDYVAMVAGNTDDMAAMMDNVRTMKAMKALQEAGLDNPGDCVTNLHKSYLVIQR